MVMTVLVADPALEQRRTALKSANAVRLKRAEAKDQVKAGELELAELIEHPPDWMLTATIGSVVQWEHGIGRWRAGRILSGLTTPATRIGTLGERTRAKIAQRFRDTAPGGRWT